MKLCNISALSYFEMHNFPPLFPYFAHYPQLKSENFNHSVMSDSLQLHGLQSSRLLCPWNSPGKKPRVGCHSLLQGIFLTQGLNPGLLHCQQILYHLSHQGKRLVTNRDSTVTKSSTFQNSNNLCNGTCRCLFRNSVVF